MLAQRSGHPVQQTLALFFAWLGLFLFRGHMPEEGLLLHPVKQIQPLGKIQIEQVVQPDVPFLNLLVMTIKTVVAMRSST